MSKELTLTSFDDLLGDYKEGTVELSTGKVFSIQNFSPGNLLIEIGSPLVDMMTEASETDLRRLPLDVPGTTSYRVWTQFEQIVCDNVISIRFSTEAQNVLPRGVVSLKRLSLVEIQELYVKIRDLSITPEELETFRAVEKPDNEESEQQGVDTEDSEDSGEE